MSRLQRGRCAFAVMTPRRPLIAGAAAIAFALAGALAFESVYDDFDSHPTTRPGHALTRAIQPGRGRDRRAAASAAARGQRRRRHPARRHGERTTRTIAESFREVILEEPPYVDAAAFERVDLEWRAYVERMLEYGNNAIAVPLLLELIDFDRLTLPGRIAERRHVYGVDEPIPRAARGVRRSLRAALRMDRRRGMQVFLDTDMLALTPPLARHLRTLAPDASAAGIDTSDPAVWAGLSRRARGAVRGVAVHPGTRHPVRRRRQPLQHRRLAVSQRDGRPQTPRVCGPCFEGCCRCSKRATRRSCFAAGRSASGRSVAFTSIPASTTRSLGDIDSPALDRVDQVHGRRLLQLSAAQSDARRRAPSTARRAAGETGVRGLRRVPRLSW